MQVYLPLYVDADADTLVVRARGSTGAYRLTGRATVLGRDALRLVSAATRAAEVRLVIRTPYGPVTSPTWDWVAPSPLVILGPPWNATTLPESLRFVLSFDGYVAALN